LEGAAIRAWLQQALSCPRAAVPKGRGSKPSSHCSYSWQNEIRYVDKSAIVEWDIIASNGIIHVISEPLKAPPAPVSTQGFFFFWVVGGGCGLHYPKITADIYIFPVSLPYMQFQLKRLL